MSKVSGLEACAVYKESLICEHDYNEAQELRGALKAVRKESKETLNEQLASLQTNKNIQEHNMRSYLKPPTSKSHRNLPEDVREDVKEHFELTDESYSLKGITTYNDELRRLNGVETIMPTEAEVLEGEIRQLEFDEMVERGEIQLDE
jgi:hypothetical protein